MVSPVSNAAGIYSQNTSKQNIGGGSKTSLPNYGTNRDYI